MTWEQCYTCKNNLHRKEGSKNVICRFDALDQRFSFPFHNEDCKGYKEVEE